MGCTVSVVTSSFAAITDVTARVIRRRRAKERQRLLEEGDALTSSVESASESDDEDGERYHAARGDACWSGEDEDEDEDDEGTRMLAQKTRQKKKNQREKERANGW